MYAYFLPASLDQTPDKRQLDRLRLRLRTSRISGEFCNYHNLDELNQFVVNNTSSGTKNFVAIGGDKDFHALLNAAAHLKDTAFGFIPTTKTSLVAQKLGIDNPRQAYSILAHRKIRSMPILQLTLGDQHAVVFTETRFDLSTNTELQIKVDGSLEISAVANRIEIINNLFDEPDSKPIVLNLYNHLDDASDRRQQPIIKLKHEQKHTRKTSQQIAHLQADSIEVYSKASLQNQLLTTPAHQLTLRQADLPINVINKKHNELSSES